MLYKIVLSLSIAVFFLSPTLFAQRANMDSLSLSAKIGKDQETLGRLLNQVDQVTREKHESALQAQRSADDNSTAANNLTANPQDKQLAKEAERKGNKARTDARKARRASDRLDHLNKDIATMQDLIAKNQIRLSRYASPAGTMNNPMPMPPTPTPVDTTNHN